MTSVAPPTETVQIVQPLGQPWCWRSVCIKGAHPPLSIEHSWFYSTTYPAYRISSWKWAWWWNIWNSGIPSKLRNHEQEKQSDCEKCDLAVSGAHEAQEAHTQSWPLVCWEDLQSIILYIPKVQKGQEMNGGYVVLS